MSPTRHSDLPLAFAHINHRLHEGRRFGIKPDDLRRHVWVLGRTGTGKSTLLETLFVAHLEAGHGAGLIDPHGDLAERVLARLPRSRRPELVLVDPTRDPKPSLNLVGHVDVAARPLAAATALAVLRKTFADGWGPRTEHLVRHSLLTLLDFPRSTLGGVLRLLVDERFRDTVLRHVREPAVRFFWEQEFPAMSPAFRAEVTAPVQNKIGALVTNPYVRAHVEQPKRALAVRQLMDEGRVLIANLSKGRIGEDASGFLGTILLAMVQSAAYQRSDVPAAARRPFTLFVDEFATFATPSFAELLAEARKYGLGLVLANQSLSQIDARLRGALLGNVGTSVVFRVSAEDALALEPEFAPEMRAGDLARLGRYEMAIKLSIDGLTSAPFTATTLASGDGGRVGTRGAIRSGPPPSALS